MILIVVFLYFRHCSIAFIFDTHATNRQVLDFNDNVPIFARDSYEFWIEENAARNTILGTISATDADAGLNAEIRYSLLTNNTNFAINSKSGNFLCVRVDEYRN